MPASQESWILNGGNVRAAVESIASARKAGAILRVEMEPSSLRRAREEGLSREQEGVLLRKAWEAVTERLPRDAVGRRASWSRLDFALGGSLVDLSAAGHLLVAALRGDRALRGVHWHLLFTEVFNEEPTRTFMCDPGYDLQEVKGTTAIVWVRPYPGQDWREPQRYPTVTVLYLQR